MLIKNKSTNTILEFVLREKNGNRVERTCPFTIYPGGVIECDEIVIERETVLYFR